MSTPAFGSPQSNHSNVRRTLIMFAGVITLAIIVVGIATVIGSTSKASTSSAKSSAPAPKASRAPSIRKTSPIASSGPPALNLDYQPRIEFDSTGFGTNVAFTEPWDSSATLQQVADHWEAGIQRSFNMIEVRLHSQSVDPPTKVSFCVNKSACLLGAGKPEQAYATLKDCRERIEKHSRELQQQFLYTLIYFQGLSSLRRGENENCIMCRGESSCILPISPAAVHKHPSGSRMAIHHFTEYLTRFPDDLEVRWLLNLAHMTLGEYPENVDPKYLVSIDRYLNSEFDIGRFRDIGHLVGVNRFNMSGGAIMEDFNNDGLFDIAVSSFDHKVPLAIFRNTGDGHFEDLKNGTGTEKQLGGLSCVQTDYNNDGLMDIFVPRGAWIKVPIRPSLLRNDGNFHFTDVTEAAGLQFPVNSNVGLWADYDNDGWVDLFLANESHRNRLYRNLGNGTFEEVADKAGLTPRNEGFGKGCAWIDYDNDDYPDLFINFLYAPAQLYHNERDGTFRDVSAEMGLTGPTMGFSVWAWDYNNDGFIDILATSFARTVEDVVKGLMGVPHSQAPTKLYRNVGGERFEDVTKEAGLDMVFATMGSNFGDFDNDGFLDMYLGTGAPSFSMLVPNRMFKNVAGTRFAEISASAGTGHLQKGHGIACGDWDRDGNIDIFAQMGGAVKGDEYHDVLFQNPGHDNSWLTVKLVGQKTNRAALGARIKVVTTGESPMTVHRHITQGSSFGSSPMQQTIGLGKTDRIAELTIHWPTSGTTQTFRDLDVNQAIRITEFAEDFEKMDYTPIPVPKGQVIQP